MGKPMNEDAPRRMIQTASGLKPMPTAAELAARSREIARQVLLESGHDPATIEETVTKFLAKSPSLKIPSWEELKAMYPDASK